MIPSRLSLGALGLLAGTIAMPPSTTAIPAAGLGDGGRRETGLIRVQRDVVQPQGEKPGVPSVQAAGSQRKAILDALRVPIERDLKQPVVFAVRKYTVIGDWAFAMGTPKRPNGAEIAWAQTVCSGDVSHLVGGLMKRDGSGWSVRAYALCPTDVAWDGWPAEHGAPKELFR